MKHYWYNHKLYHLHVLQAVSFKIHLYKNIFHQPFHHHR